MKKLLEFPLKSRIYSTINDEYYEFTLIFEHLSNAGLVKTQKSCQNKRVDVNDWKKRELSRRKRVLLNTNLAD